MSIRTTLTELLAGADADAPAIGAPGRATLSFGELRAHCERMAARIHALGAGRGDTVAIVISNGPEMASAFVCAASAAAVAPLNPSYTRDELDFYLRDLEPALLIVDEANESPAADAARSLGIRVARLRAKTAASAGLFELEGSECLAADGRIAEPDDVALVLHTSGTTSRPKIVPLTHANLCASAVNIARSLELTQADRCLNIMPLFHIHGLVAAVLASLGAGASVHCTPGFNALKFFRWLEEVRPSWYTGVPTMHQSILDRAGRHAAAIAASQLRFIRSSSASLPAPVMAALEETFGVPVIEAYGMTEAGHQMASNPLPPGERKPGSVGVAAGPEICVLSEDGQPLPTGATGEVAIRGLNVTPGYRNNEAANAQAFVGEWFRTGDLGVFDDGGYLRLTGRLKEIINRGGEKISPREIDDVLIEHPDIVQVVTFAVPHEKLGEDVAAAVVLVDNATIDAAGIRAFAAERLAPMKIPRTIRIVDEIPKGATGKLQRIGLAEKLGLA